jgi:hypothetical protein
MKLNSPVNIKEFQGCPNGGVADLVHGLARFDFPIDNPKPVFEKGREIAAGQITEFIDSGGQHSPAMGPVPAGVIGSSTQKRNSERGSTYDHP